MNDIERKYQREWKEKYRKKHREEYNEYMKKWKRENKEHIKNYNKKWNNYHNEWNKKHRPQLNEYAKEWRQKNKSRVNAYQRELYQKSHKKLWDEIINLLGGKCANPYNIDHGGFSNDVRCLQIDHINGGGHKEREKFSDAETQRRFILKQIKAGSKNYQLLCANCNWIKKKENKERKKTISEIETAATFL